MRKYAESQWKQERKCKKKNRMRARLLECVRACVCACVRACVKERLRKRDEIRRRRKDKQGAWESKVEKWNSKRTLKRR